MIILVALFVGCSRLLCSVWNDTAHHHHGVGGCVFWFRLLCRWLLAVRIRPVPFRTR